MSLHSDSLVLLASAAQTAAGQSGTFDLSGYEMGVIHLELTAATSLTALAVFLQESPDGTNWEGAAAGVSGGVPFFGGITLAAFTAPQHLAFVVGQGVSGTGSVPGLSKYSRIAWTMTGTSATFSVSGDFYHPY